MRSIGLLALNDLRLTLRDRPALLWLVVMPIAMMWFFGNLGGGGSGTPKIELGIDDRDGGWLAAAFVEELADERLAIPDRADPDLPARTLVIPQGFTAGVLAGQVQTLRLEKQPDSNAEFGIAAEAHVFRAVTRTLGRLVEMHEAGSLETDERAAERFRALGERENLVRLAVTTAGRGRAVPSGRAQSVPGMLTFTVMMMTLIYGAVFLTNEKRSGMLERQAVLPMGRRAVFLGKLLGRLVIAGVQVAVLVFAGRYLFGVSWGSSPLGLALMLVSYCVAVGALSTLLGAVLANPAQASAVGWIGSMVMAALGGCWWPAEVMPDWMRAVSRAFPTAWAMEGFHSLISFGNGAREVLPAALVLLAFGAGFSLLGARLLRFEK